MSHSPNEELARKQKEAKFEKLAEQFAKMAQDAINKGKDCQIVTWSQDGVINGVTDYDHRRWDKIMEEQGYDFMTKGIHIIHAGLGISHCGHHYELSVGSRLWQTKIIKRVLRRNKVMPENTVRTDHPGPNDVTFSVFFRW